MATCSVHLPRTPADAAPAKPVDRAAEPVRELRALAGGDWRDRRDSSSGLRRLAECDVGRRFPRCVGDRNSMGSRLVRRATDAMLQRYGSSRALPLAVLS